MWQLFMVLGLARVLCVPRLLADHCLIRWWGIRSPKNPLLCAQRIRSEPQKRNDSKGRACSMMRFHRAVNILTLWHISGQISGFKIKLKKKAHNTKKHGNTGNIIIFRQCICSFACNEMVSGQGIVTRWTQKVSRVQAVGKGAWLLIWFIHWTINWFRCFKTAFWLWVIL